MLERDMSKWRIEPGFMVFTGEGREGIGAVRQVGDTSLVLYVENSGEFEVPLTAVKSVHDQKVVLAPHLLDKAVLEAVSHAHDREDPKLVG
jgi:hypothetical protein